MLRGINMRNNRVRSKANKKYRIAYILLAITMVSVFMVQVILNKKNNVEKSKLLLANSQNAKINESKQEAPDSNTGNEKKHENIVNKEEKKEEEPVVEVTSLKKGSNTSIEGDSYTFNSAEVKKIIDGTYVKDGKKIAFLTFDDGPSAVTTPKILATLKKYNVKATFFILGKNLDSYPKSKELLKEILHDGHAIANHSYSHDYKYLYPGGSINTENLIADFDKNENKIKEVLGADFKTSVVRLPGGMMSWKNKDNAKQALNSKGLNYIDWNSLNGDAEGGNKTPQQLLERTKNTVHGHEKIILLMHDTKGNTAEALGPIIEYLKSQGYEFKTLK